MRLETQEEWDQHWIFEYNKYYDDPRTRSKAFEYANETMLRKFGARPAGPPSLKWLSFRAFWLLKVKKMDWTKLLIGGLAAAVGAAAAAIPAMAEGGISAAEWWSIGGLALGALALYLKNPDAKGFAHPTRKNGK